MERMEGEREAVIGFSNHSQHMGDGKMVIFGLMRCVAWKGTQGVFVVKNCACVCPTVSPLVPPPSSLLPHFLPILFVFKRALRGSRRRCSYTTHTLTRRGRLDVHTCDGGALVLCVSGCAFPDAKVSSDRLSEMSNRNRH